MIGKVTIGTRSSDHGNGKYETGIQVYAGKSLKSGDEIKIPAAPYRFFVRVKNINPDPANGLCDALVYWDDRKFAFVNDSVEIHVAQVVEGGG